jgi:hypothetical protein
VIDITVPRECVYQHFEKRPDPCPRCGSPLQSCYATYLVATRRGKKSADSFIISNDKGWFCPRCPTVVISPEEVSEHLVHNLPYWDVGSEFVLLGIVDLDSIPEEKRDVPLGDDDNPVPLVEFTTISREKPRRSPSQQYGAAAGKHTPSAREGSFEERYEDVLQNIEFGIVQVYHDNPELTDWDALTAIEALIRSYHAEAKGCRTTLPSLSPLAEEIYNSVRPMCQWRLGRETLFLDEGGESADISPEPVTLDEIIACLKRIRKSINRWNRTGGRQGYLVFAEQFVA